MCGFVAKKARAGCLAVRAKNWSLGAKRFLQKFAEAGNVDAAYIFGMIMFYCIKSCEDGIAKISSAALEGHKEAINSLAVIVFNGSGEGEESRDIFGDTELCARAASLGHVIALRELGFCMHDGYGIQRSSIEGRNLVYLARAREMAEALDPSGSLLGPTEHGKGGQPTLANRFMIEWFEGTPRIVLDNNDDHVRMCSNPLCGRQETRIRKFRRCSVCARVNYCSRACQSRNWTHHKTTCTPV